MSNIFAQEQNRRGRVPHLAVLVWNDPIPRFDEYVTGFIHPMQFEKKVIVIRSTQFRVKIKG